MLNFTTPQPVEDKPAAISQGHRKISRPEKDAVECWPILCRGELVAYAKTLEDARLITAAPCLLAALVALVDAIDLDEDTGRHCTRARAAIAQATGGGT